MNDDCARLNGATKGPASSVSRAQNKDFDIAFFDEHRQAPHTHPGHLLGGWGGAAPRYVLDIAGSCYFLFFPNSECYGVLISLYPVPCPARCPEIVVHKLIKV